MSFWRSISCWTPSPKTTIITCSPLTGPPTSMLRRRLTRYLTHSQCSIMGYPSPDAPRRHSATKSGGLVCPSHRLLVAASSRRTAPSRLMLRTSGIFGFVHSLLDYNTLQYIFYRFEMIDSYSLTSVLALLPSTQSSSPPSFRRRSSLSRPSRATCPPQSAR